MITYDERARFYYEETYSEIDHYFIKEIIKRYSIKSACDIPCGAGRNLDLLAQNCQHAMFGDFEINMVNQVKKKIENYNLKNCISFVADINNYCLNEKVDMTIVMRQALQLFSPERMRCIIENLIANTSNIIVLDTYYFGENLIEGEGPEYLREKVKVFCFNNKTIVRTSSVDMIDDGILVNYTYTMEQDKWQTHFKLYNINPKYIKELLVKNKVKRVWEYQDYSFKLRKNENSNILVIEL